MDRRGRFGVAMADLRGDAGAGGWGSAGEPVHTRGGELIAVQRLARPHRYRGTRGINPDHVKRDRRGQAKPLALTHREAVDAPVLTEDGALDIPDGALCRG